MYFIVSGKLAYFSGYSEKMPRLVSAGRWMCEPVLWCLGWNKRGAQVGRCYSRYGMKFCKTFR